MFFYIQFACIRTWLDLLLQVILCYGNAQAYASTPHVPELQVSWHRLIWFHILGLERRSFENWVRLSSLMIQFPCPRLRLKYAFQMIGLSPGGIQNPNIYHHFFVVDVAKVSGFAPVSLDRDMKFEPYRKVAVVWRHFDSGSLEYRSGVVLSSPIAPTFNPLLSTCRIHKVS
jgi:hypothetical protein